MITQSDSVGESTSFIVFMLICLLESVREFKVTNKVTNKTLSKSEKEVIKHIKKDSHVTIERLSSLVGLSESDIKKILASLRNKDILKRRGANKNGQWIIKK